MHLNVYLYAIFEDKSLIATRVAQS